MAVGSGCEVAMGAFHMGATAVEAVDAACGIISSCSLPVEFEKIEQKSIREVLKKA